MVAGRDWGSGDVKCRQCSHRGTVTASRRSFRIRGIAPSEGRRSKTRTTGMFHRSSRPVCAMPTRSMRSTPPAASTRGCTAPTHVSRQPAHGASIEAPRCSSPHRSSQWLEMGSARASGGRAQTATSASDRTCPHRTAETQPADSEGTESARPSSIDAVAIVWDATPR
jgi:hypothetical protein